MKIYQGIAYLNFEYELIIDEKLVKIPFKGGRRYPNYYPGTYATDDKVIQQALENSKHYNTLFKLIQVDDKVLEKGETSVSLDERLVKLEKENKEWMRKYSELEAAYNALKSEPIPPEVKEIPDITNAQQAKEYLISIGEDPEKLKNKMLILNSAKKNKITFPDWK